MNSIQRMRGFTIIELLVVVVIVTIISSVSIITYASIKNSSIETVIQSDLKNNISRIIQYRAVNGLYPNTLEWQKSEFAPNESNPRYRNGLWLWCSVDPFTPQNRWTAIIIAVKTSTGKVYSASTLDTRPKDVTEYYEANKSKNAPECLYEIANKPELRLGNISGFL